MSREPRSIVYVDGFNLYYGVLKGTPYKWLNLQRYFEMIRHGDDLQQIYYFTAPLKGAKLARQRAYLQALGAQPSVSIVTGRFKTKRVVCRVHRCTHPGQRVFSSAEEKETDVNIALQMIDDAYQDCADLFVLVSGDSDLVPAVALLKERFPEKQVFVYVPNRNPRMIRGAATQIRAIADKARYLPLDKLERAQFPDEVSFHGTRVKKPTSW